MPTENRRVAAYLPKQLDDRFKAFIAERNLKGESQALVVILSEFLGVAHDSESFSSSLLSTRVDAIEKNLAQLKGDLLRELHVQIASLRADIGNELSGELQSEPQVATSEALDPIQLDLSSVQEVDKPLLAETPADLPDQLDTSIPIAQNAPPLSDDDFTKGLTGSALEKRLGVPHSTFYSRKQTSSFYEWVKSEDPDKLAWFFEPEKKKFFPVLEPSPNQINPLPVGSERSEEG